jgi:hypothetical protein
VIGYLKRWNARRLQDRKDAEQHTQLLLDIDDVHRWCDGEARDVARWLLDRNAWRFGFTTTDTKRAPERISEFRTELYAKRSTQTLQS